MIAAIYLVLVAAAACFAYRLWAGPTLPDRVLAVDGLLVVGMSGVTVHAMQTRVGYYIPVVVVLSLVGFISTAVVGRFIEGRTS